MKLYDDNDKEWRFFGIFAVSVLVTIIGFFGVVAYLAITVVNAVT